MPDLIYRSATITRNDDGSISVSSDQPVKMGSLGIEVLDHSPSAIDLSKAQHGLSVLMEHDPIRAVAMADNPRVANSKLRFDITSWRSSKEAQEAKADYENKSLRHVSIGYKRNTIQDLPDIDGVRAFKTTSWTPHEISFTSVPADTSVGVGRSENAGKDIISKCLSVMPDTANRTYSEDEVQSKIKEEVKRSVEDAQKGFVERSNMREQLMDKYDLPKETRQKLRDSDAGELEIQRSIL